MKLEKMVFMKIFKDKNLFDFSNYPQNTKFFDPVNKKIHIS